MTLATRKRWKRPLPDEAFFHILREFPNLRIVHINFYGNDRGIEELAKLRHLSELQIYGLLGLPVGSVQLIAWISQLKKLQILQVNCLGSRLTGFEALADLQHLKLIVFGRGCPDATLQEVASLPHLAQLAIDEPQTRGNRPTQSGFEALRRAPALKTVILFGVRPGFKSDLLAIAQSALPDCLVTTTPPRGVQRERAPQAWMAMFILAVALGVQLSCAISQSGQPTGAPFCLGPCLAGTGIERGPHWLDRVAIHSGRIHVDIRFCLSHNGSDSDDRSHGGHDSNGGESEGRSASASWHFALGAGLDPVASAAGFEGASII